ncbi:MAG: histidine kinase dimerization/phospho-acceptor domain-containing protein, partial [Pseudomonadota bacterium]
DAGLIVTRRDGMIAYANPMSAELLGVASASDMRLLEDAFNPDPDANATLFRLSRAVERNRARTEDIYLPARAGLGAGRWLRVSARPFADATPDAELRGAAMWSLTDITRDKTLEAQARAGLEDELGVYQQMPAGFLVASTDGRLQYTNAYLKSALGLAAEDTDREWMIADLAAGDGAELLTSLANADASGSQCIELDLVTAEGLAWPAMLVLQSTSPADQDDDTVPRTFSAIVLPQVGSTGEESIDVSDMADGRAGFFRNAPFGIATVSSEGLISGANTAFARLLVSGEAANGASVRQAVARATTVEGVAAFNDALEAAFEGQANIAPIELTVGEKQDFTRRLFFATAGTAPNRSAVIYVIDATEQKALEERFAQSQKMEVVGKLAGGIAHDFNNVMTAIIGFSDLLLGTHRPGDPAFQNIKSIRSSAERAADLVRNLLAFSRQQQLSPKVLQVNDVIGDVMQMLRQTTLRDSIELKIQSARDLWLVEADKNELERVVVNLSVNARDAMGDGGQLSVRTRNV